MDLRFISGSNFFSLGIPSHLKPLANVAALLAYCSQDGGATVTGTSIATGRIPGGAFSQTFTATFCLFWNGVWAFPSCQSELKSRRGVATVDGTYSALYKRSLNVDDEVWRQYRQRRLQSRGLDPDSIETGLRQVPRATPQADRWATCSNLLPPLPLTLSNLPP